MTNKNPFSVRLKEDVLQRITKYADENERSISWVINKALEQFLSIEPSPAPQQLKQPQQNKPTTPPKEQKVSTPQQKKKSPVKDFDSWYASASPQQRKHYFETGRMS